jgi:hypothetical protein
LSPIILHLHLHPHRSCLRQPRPSRGLSLTTLLRSTALALPRGLFELKTSTVQT